VNLDRVRQSLSTRRAALMMSQAELAKRMGTTQSAVSDLENGRSAPRIDTLSRWASALGLRAEISIEFKWDAAGGDA
jgi:transcriptional regulator with XRE-family HTH domain